jgi:hypothetical protein
MAVMHVLDEVMTQEPWLSLQGGYAMELHMQYEVLSQLSPLHGGYALQPRAKVDHVDQNPKSMNHHNGGYAMQT